MACRLTVIVLALLLTGCATSGMVTGRDEATRQGGQAETDAATSFSRGVHRVVAGFNDDTSQAAIQYGPNSRKVLRGASLMGWSYSEDHGDTWRYGGRLSPPRGWAVLWGDPALTTSRTSYSLVFLSNLAVPDAKFPASGIDGFFGSDVLGGACIARSTDGGVRFEHFQCVANTEPLRHRADGPRGHFYDGGSLASGPRGEIYASYVDVDTSQIDVWRSPDGQQPFARLPQPFPSYYVGSHPRIRVATDGTLYLMAVVKGEGNAYGLVGSRFRDGAWESPRTILWNVAHYPQVDFGSSVLGARLTLRTGPQFSFDVGVRSERFDDSVRFLVTHANNRGLYLRGGVCNEQLTSCFWHQGWTFGNPVTNGRGGKIDVFNPNVTAFQGGPLRRISPLAGLVPGARRRQHHDGQPHARHPRLHRGRGRRSRLHHSGRHRPRRSDLPGYPFQRRLLGGLRRLPAGPGGRRPGALPALHDKLVARLRETLDLQRGAPACARRLVLVLGG